MLHPSFKTLQPRQNVAQRGNIVVELARLGCAIGHRERVTSLGTS